MSDDGFDAILITAVNGVDEKRYYTTGYYDVDYRWRRFGHYYYRFQDIYYTLNYYDAYKVYHIETSIYYINEDETKSLVWVGVMDVVNPQTITSTVKDYETNIIRQLEREKLINKL